MWKLIQGGNEAVSPVLLQGPFLVYAGYSHAVEPGNWLFCLWNCRIFTAFHLTEECCVFYLKEGISLSPASISLKSMLLPWIWFFKILWFYGCFIFKIVLHFQYPQKNTSRLIENSILIPCNHKGSQAFIAGRPVKKILNCWWFLIWKKSPFFLNCLLPKLLLPVLST